MIILYGALAFCSLVGGLFVWQEVGDDPSHPKHKQVMTPPSGPVAPIPEPSTWVMMSVGGALVIAFVVAQGKK